MIRFEYFNRSNFFQHYIWIEIFFFLFFGWFFFFSNAFIDINIIFWRLIYFLHLNSIFSFIYEKIIFSSIIFYFLYDFYVIKFIDDKMIIIINNFTLKYLLWLEKYNLFLEQEGSLNYTMRDAFDNGFIYNTFHN